MDPELRSWWRLLDELPQKIDRLHAWTNPQLEPPTPAGHMHANPTIMACLRGVVHVSHGNGPGIDLAPGDVLFISPGVWHDMAPLRSGSIAFGQGFLTSCSDICLWGSDRTWCGRLPLEPCRGLLQEAEGMVDPLRRTFLIKSVLRQTLAENIEPLSFPDPAMQAMAHLLWSRFHMGLTVDELLNASGLGRSRGYTLFTQGYGTPPGVAIRTMRLWLAGSLLATGCSVAEASRRSGWPSSATFGRAWNNAHGLSPRAFSGRAGTASSLGEEIAAPEVGHAKQTDRSSGGGLP